MNRVSVLNDQILDLIEGKVESEQQKSLESGREEFNLTLVLAGVENTLREQ
jgi:hypothetical protein